MKFIDCFKNHITWDSIITVLEGFRGKSIAGVLAITRLKSTTRAVACYYFFATI